MITELISSCNFYLYCIHYDLYAEMWKPRNFWYTFAFSGKKINNGLRRIIFLPFCNVYCFPKIKSKRTRATTVSSVVFLSDLVAVSSKERDFGVSGGILSTRVRKQKCWFSSVSTACEVNFKSSRWHCWFWSCIISEEQSTGSESTANFFSYFWGKRMMPSFWCCCLWDKQLTSLERSVVW